MSVVPILPIIATFYYICIIGMLYQLNNCMNYNINSCIILILLFYVLCTKTVNPIFVDISIWKMIKQNMIRHY